MRAIALLALVAACGDGDVPRPRAPAAPPTTTTPAAAAPAATRAAPSGPVLAAAPSVDLTANAVRWTIEDAGVIVPVASEGLRKYDLEYRSPWGDVRTMDGEPGRALAGRRAVLTIPWPSAAAARIVVRARGTGTLGLSAGRTKLGSARLDGRWQTLRFDAATLPGGELALRLDAAKGTRIRHLEVIPAGAAAGCARDGLAPLTPAAPGGGLGGVARMSILLHVPAGAYLAVTPSAAASARARVRVTAEDGTTETLLDGEVPAGEQIWPLARFADRLVRLEIDDPRCAATWRGARLAIAARPELAGPPATAAKHLVLLVVDTLRADRVQVMRDTPVATPRLTAAARDHGVVFRGNQSMAPSSPPSHATIHTGQIPRVHGAAGDTGAVHADAPVLARVLGDAGFRTIYVGNNDFAMGKLRKVARWDVAKTMTRLGKGIDCGPMIDEALAQLRAARDAGARAFVTILPIEPHVPYRQHPGVTDKYYAGAFDPMLRKQAGEKQLARVRRLGAADPRWAQLRALYDGEVEHLDACFGALEDGVAALGLAGDTALVVTSDHGEGLGERGGHVGHAYGLHGELIDVPLIVLAPGLVARAVDVLTSNLEIAPTVLDLVGLPPDPRMQAASLMPLARAGAPWPNRIVASEYGRSYALRGGRWRMVVDYDGRYTLHDVTADPEEARDLAKDAPMARQWLREAAGLYLAHRVAWRPTWGNLGDLAPGSPLDILSR